MDQVGERCDQCGFDARDWGVLDAASVLDALGWWWDLATVGIGPVDLNRRPAPGVWSALEYGLHSAFVTALLREAIDRMLAEDGATLTAPPPPGSAAPEPLVLERARVVADAAREGGALGGLVRRAPADAWTHEASFEGGRVGPEAALRHAVHDATHHWMDVGHGLATIAAGTPAGRGRVVQVNASGGGVPKRAVGEAVVGRRGVEGDVQADRRHHGRPFQALCLWSADVIEELRGDGHDLSPGSAGENLTLADVDWATLRPGARLAIGDLLAEVSFPATPCAKQTRWFRDGDFRRIGHDVNPQWTRWYAWVRHPGTVGPGDEVVVQRT